MCQSILYVLVQMSATGCIPLLHCYIAAYFTLLCLSWQFSLKYFNHFFDREQNWKKRSHTVCCRPMFTAVKWRTSDEGPTTGVQWRMTTIMGIATLQPDKTMVTASYLKCLTDFLDRRHRWYKISDGGNPSQGGSVSSAVVALEYERRPKKEKRKE